jgi:hypothetical protein
VISLVVGVVHLCITVLMKKMLVLDAQVRNTFDMDRFFGCMQGQMESATICFKFASVLVYTTSE